MDNRTIDIVSEGNKSLEMALNIIWTNCPGGKATHYKIVKLKETISYYGKPTDSHYSKLEEDQEGEETLILLWHEEKGAAVLPYPLELEDAISFVKGWLKNTNYHDEPDHDGSNGKGWRIFTEQWGHVAGHSYAIVGVQPRWAMYGK